MVAWDERGFRVGPRRVPWGELLRVAYVTEDTGPVADDHFLALGTVDGILRLPLSSPEVRAFASHLERMLGFVYGPKGCLAHSTANESVVVWPPEEAGLGLREATERASR